MVKNVSFVKDYEKIINGDIKVEYCTSLRKLIFKNKLFPYKCNKCHIKSWNKNPLTLEIEHKDGDRFNNTKENLELLCPNCHSQTKTFRKNRRKISKPHISEEKILEEINKVNNINQLLLNLDLSNSGGNYKRIHKIIKKNNLESFYNLPKVNKTKKLTISEKKQIRINIIKNSNIDFSKNSWGVKLSKLFNITPFASRNFVKNNLPDFWERCAKQSK